MVSKKQSGLILIILLLLAFLVVAKGGLLPLTEIGYITGAQGLQAEFHSVWFNNTYCSTTEKPSWASKASSWSFGYEMDFDPDVRDDGWCDLCATQQPMTVDTDVEPKHYSWSVDQGTVTLSNGTKVEKAYQFEMWRYRLTWRINIWLSGTEGEACDETMHFVTWEPNYGGSVLWIRLVPKSFVYFKDNPDAVYFAPAYIGLNSISWASTDQNGQKIQDDAQMMSTQDLIPKASGETLGIYYTRGGTPINLESELLKYQGMSLDTSIFRNEYWTRIIFQTFKPLNGFSYGIWHWWKYPSAHLEFTVYVYVVGRWTVYFATGEVPQLAPHIPVSWTQNPIDAFFAALASALTNPLTQFWLILIVIVIVLIFAGPTIVALIAALRKKG